MLKKSFIRHLLFGISLLDIIFLPSTSVINRIL
jgi:hypothetical protein